MIKTLAFCAIAGTYCYEYYLRVTPSVISQEPMQRSIASYAGSDCLLLLLRLYITADPYWTLIDKFGPRKVLTMACGLCW
jgi:hypothetical protein